MTTGTSALPTRHDRRPVRMVGGHLPPIAGDAEAIEMTPSVAAPVATGPELGRSTGR